MADEQQQAPRNGSGVATDDSDQSRKMSPWAIAGIIVAILCGPLGLLVNAYALHTISRTGQRGQTLAAVGIGLSVIATIFTLILAGSISFVTQIDY